jgi:hypothetical protein
VYIARKIRNPAARRAIYNCLLSILWVWSSVAKASHPVYESLEQVLARTERAMQVEIVDANEQRDGASYWRTLKVSVRPLHSVFGEDPIWQKHPKRDLECRYQEGLPHRRGDTMVSPLVSGSGLEFNVRAGDRVVLLIEGSAASEKSCRLLRIEPLGALDRIVKPKPK